MNMFLAVAGGVAGLVLLYLGADGLVKGGGAIAVRLGVSPLIVGLTLVAFGTSAPELFVSVTAANQGLGDICVGNAIGSNICNVALVLGLSALVAPLAVDPALIRRDIPMMIATSVVFALMTFVFGGMGRIAGALFVGALICYTALGIARSRCSAADRDKPEGVGMPLGIAVLVSVLGLAALVVGAKFLLSCAVSIATGFGVSDERVALTVVAVGTSFPELATSIVAARDGESEIAIGNLVGSNIFNILGVLGVSALVAPFESKGVGTADYVMMVATSALVWFLAVNRRRFGKREGLLLLGLYAAYLVGRVAVGRFG